MKKTKKQNKALIIGIIAALLLVPAFFFLYEQQKINDLKNLNVTIAELTFKEFTTTEAQLTLSVNIHNPNPRTVTVGTFTANVHSNDKLVTTFELDKQLIIPAEEDVTHHFTIPLNYVRLGSAIINLIIQERANWNVTGTYNFESLGVTKEVPFTLP